MKVYQPYSVMRAAVAQDVGLVEDGPGSVARSAIAKLDGGMSCRRCRAYRLQPRSTSPW